MNNLLLFSHSVTSDSVMPWNVACQASLPSPSTWTCANSCPSSCWCHTNVSFYVVPFSSCLQSFLVSGSFLMNQIFASGEQNIRGSASASVLPTNIHDWFPLGLTNLFPLKFKGLARVFSSNTVQKYQFFSAQPSLWSSLTSVHDYWISHSFDCLDLCQQSDVSAFQYTD